MIIHHHLGLGDHFVCNGLVNYLSRTHKIDLICKKHNKPTVDSLYFDNSNVKIISIIGDNEIKESAEYARETHQKILHIGFSRCDPSCWDRSFYQQLDIDFVERYRMFHIPQNLPNQIHSNSTDFMLIHNECSEGSYNLQISNNKSLEKFYLKKTDTNNLLSYINLIRQAKEIHCVNSSIFHLIDSLPHTTSELYYHNIRQHPCSFEISKKWKMVNYA